MQREAPPHSLAGRRRITLPNPLDVASVIASGGIHSPHGGSVSPSGLARGGDFTSLFEVGRTLGSGTSSVVKLVTRRADRRDFAAKCVRCADEEVRQFARDEYRLLRRLRHPTILSAYETFEEPGCSYILLEYCSGGSVQDYVMQNGPFPDERAVRLFFQVLHGINHLHQRRVIHRDVKPDNLIFLTQEAKVIKISDFNSATTLGTHDGQGARVMLSHRGTHLYSAPELRFGRLWNERIDIWSCGLSFFFMLHQHLPFEEDTETSNMLKAGRQPEVRWGDNIASHVQQFLKQCFAVNFQDRPPALELLLHPIFSVACAGQGTGHLASCGILAAGLAGTAAQLTYLPPADRWYQSPSCSPLASPMPTAGDMRQYRAASLARAESPVERLLHMMAPVPSSSPRSRFHLHSDELDAEHHHASSWPLGRRIKRSSHSVWSPSRMMSASVDNISPGPSPHHPLAPAGLEDADLAKYKDLTKQRSLRLLRRLAERKFERVFVPPEEDDELNLRRPSSWCLEGTISADADMDPDVGVKDHGAQPSDDEEEAQ